MFCWIESQSIIVINASKREEKPAPKWESRADWMCSASSVLTTDICISSRWVKFHSMDFIHVRPKEISSRFRFSTGHQSSAVCVYRILKCFKRSKLSHLNYNFQIFTSPFRPASTSIGFWRVSSLSCWPCIKIVWARPEKPIWWKKNRSKSKIHLKSEKSARLHLMLLWFLIWIWAMHDM